jgi:hypothetical protein
VEKFTLLEEEKKNPDDWVYLIDFQYLPNDYAPPAAIKGALKVKSDDQIEEIFEPNTVHIPIAISRKVLLAYMQR